MEIYQTRGTCARAIQFEVDDSGVVTKVKFIGGCAGNTQGVARLAEITRKFHYKNTVLCTQCDEQDNTYLSVDAYRQSHYQTAKHSAE